MKSRWKRWVAHSLHDCEYPSGSSFCSDAFRHEVNGNDDTNANKIPGKAELRINGRPSGIPMFISIHQVPAAMPYGTDLLHATQQPGSWSKRAHPVFEFRSVQASFFCFCLQGSLDTDWET